MLLHLGLLYQAIFPVRMALKMLKIGSNQRCEQRDGERSKGGEHMEKRP